MKSEFINKSKYYIILFLIVSLASLLIRFYFKEYILNIDLRFSNYVSSSLTNTNLTYFFRVITHFGGEIFYTLLLVILLITSNNKKPVIFMIVNVLITLLMSNILKIIIRRERPLVSLIDRPLSYSFPSGHSMCAVAFYGMLIYIINKKTNNKYLRILFNILLTIIILLIMFSRVYLNVHYLSDIIIGGIFGLLVLLIVINYDKVNNII